MTTEVSAIPVLGNLDSQEDLDAFEQDILLPFELDEPVLRELTLPRFPGNDSIRSVEVSLQRRDRKLLRSMMTVGTIAIMAVGRYLSNAEEGKIEHLHDIPSVSNVYTAHDPANDTIIYDFEGLTGKDAADAASSEVAYMHIGDVRAMRYGGDVQPEPLAKAIIKDANQSGKKRIILSARSAGGPVEIATAAVIVQRDQECNEMEVEERAAADVEQSCPLFDIRAIFMDSSPFGIDSVRPEKLTYNDYIEWTVANIYGVEYSSDVNFGVQALARILNNPTSIRPDNIALLPYSAYEYYQKVNSAKKASALLIMDEFDAISAARIHTNLEILGSLPEVERPIIMLMQPEELGADRTILSDVAAAQYAEATEENGLMFYLLRIPGIVHANPGYRPGEWNQGVELQLIPTLQQAESFAKFRKTIRGFFR